MNREDFINQAWAKISETLTKMGINTKLLGQKAFIRDMVIDLGSAATNPSVSDLQQYILDKGYHITEDGNLEYQTSEILGRTTNHYYEVNKEGNLEVIETTKGEDTVQNARGEMDIKETSSKKQITYDNNGLQIEEKMADYENFRGDPLQAKTDFSIITRNADLVTGNYIASDYYPGSTAQIMDEHTPLINTPDLGRSKSATIDVTGSQFPGGLGGIRYMPKDAMEVFQQVNEQELNEPYDKRMDKHPGIIPNPSGLQDIRSREEYVQGRQEAALKTDPLLARAANARGVRKDLSRNDESR